MSEKLTFNLPSLEVGSADNFWLAICLRTLREASLNQMRIVLPPPIGSKINRLTLVSILPPRKGHKMAEWKCECGNLVICRITAVLTENTSSCGCFHKENWKKFRKDCYKHGLSKTREYAAWKNMHGRCYNPNDHKFKTYGARGIAVCDRWNGESGFENFYYDMGPKPSPAHSVERVNVNGNYDPLNCIWATMDVQAKNKTNTVRLTLDGRQTYQRELARTCGVNANSVAYLLRKGWAPEQIRDHYKRKAAPCS